MAEDEAQAVERDQNIVPGRTAFLLQGIAIENAQYVPLILRAFPSLEAK